jgi:L-asparaginase II
MNPILVEVLRGDRVESCHRGAAVACDAAGRVVVAHGDIARAIYPRSAVKPLQALPLVASGAADRFGLTAAEIALACGSHTGEPLHVATAESLLHKAGSTSASLECGVHWPLGESAARDLAAREQSPTPLHNNCSGKHAGFICLACHLGHDPAGYVEPGHPVMREVTAALATATDARLDDSCRGIDGCSIPTYAMPLLSLATGFARLGTGDRLPSTLRQAASRIRHAVAAQPWAIAGTGRFDTRVATALGDAVLCKVGAEGVAAATIPALGLGLAVKVDDGAGRAAEVAMAALLLRLLPDTLAGAAELALLADVPLRNWNGRLVGRIRPSLAAALRSS